MIWVGRLCKLLFIIIIAILLIFAKVRYGLHDHFFLGIGVTLIIWLISSLIKKGNDNYGK